MNVKMTQLGKFSLDGMHVSKYPQGEILGDETPDKVKAYFLLMNHAVEVPTESKPVEKKIEQPAIIPTETKIIKPEVKKNKGKNKQK